VQGLVERPAGGPKPLGQDIDRNTVQRERREDITLVRGQSAAAKAGDQAELTEAQASWARNGNQIADFLASANPKAWRRAEMRQMMRGHLKLTTDEAVARLTGNWTADVRAFDLVHTQALVMADMLSAGIISQFPQRFR